MKKNFFLFSFENFFDKATKARLSGPPETATAKDLLFKLLNFFLKSK